MAKVACWGVRSVAQPLERGCVGGADGSDQRGSVRGAGRACGDHGVASAPSALPVGVTDGGPSSGRVDFQDVRDTAPVRMGNCRSPASVDKRHPCLLSTFIVNVVVRHRTLDIVLHTYQERTFAMPSTAMAKLNRSSVQLRVRSLGSCETLDRVVFLVGMSRRSRGGFSCVGALGGSNGAATSNEKPIRPTKWQKFWGVWNAIIGCPPRTCSC